MPTTINEHFLFGQMINTNFRVESIDCSAQLCDVQTSKDYVPAAIDILDIKKVVSRSWIGLNALKLWTFSDCLRKQNKIIHTVWEYDSSKSDSRISFREETYFRIHEICTYKVLVYYVRNIWRVGYSLTVACWVYVVQSEVGIAASSVWCYHMKPEERETVFVTS